MIETEIRSLITKEEYNQLLNFFNQNAKPVKDDYQETSYFDCKEDLRIQKNNHSSKIWLKKGNLHDNSREEIEIKTNRDDFNNLEKLFNILGYYIEIKWFRKRKQFRWENIKVCLDYTKGYGYIIELEKLTTKENQEEVLQELKNKLNQLNIKETPKQEFNEKFENYKLNWKQLTNDPTSN